jgi:uncharacterized protein with HEPN domain
MPPDQLYLGDMLGAADIIARRLTAYDVDRFLADDVMQDAVLRQLLVIGEAVAHVSPELQARYPAVPWARIKAFRNFAVHRYRSVDWQRVWDTATVNVPPLRAEIASLVETEFPSDEADA